MAIFFLIVKAFLLMKALSQEPSRILLAFDVHVVQLVFKINLISVIPSYMHVDLKEKVFMHQPPDFCDPNFPMQTSQILV